MKKSNVIFALAVMLSSTAALAREVVNINRGWSFTPGDVENAMSIDFDDSKWRIVNVPHDFQIEQAWVEPSPEERGDMSNSVANVKSRLSARGFKEMGTGWYRRELEVDPEWFDGRVLLDFEGIMLVGDVYFNGARVGGTDYGYLGFEVDITDKINRGGRNVIAVKADTGKPENSRWYTGGGLFRDVKVIVTDRDNYFERHPLHVTTPDVSGERATVKVEAKVTGKMKNLPLRLAIVAPTGDTIYNKVTELKRRNRTREYELDSVTVENPRLWSCDTPELYTAVVTLENEDGAAVDRVEQPFGIRRVEFSPEFGLKLNGEKVLLKGIANHHSLGALGAAAYERALEKRIHLLKDFGFNHVRTSHNPYSESFLDLCDRNGILVVDELYDKWLTQYAGGRKEWTDLWQHDVPEFITRDRNHPSVVMWSLGNELQTLWDIPYSDWGVTPYRLQRQLLRRYDETRPVTVAMHPRGRHQSTDSLPAPLVMETDVASYNYRYMYFPGDARRFPWMMFYQSEANTSNMGPNFYDMDLDKVIGLAYWGMIDYLGESRGWPAKGWSDGVFDISLEPKPIAYFLKSIFKPEEPVVHIAVVEGEDDSVWNDVKVGTQTLTDHWNRTEGDTLALYTFTNADEVELLINGKSLGRRANVRDDSSVRNRILWEKVPYRRGAIEAVAYNHGNPKGVARHRIETTGKAVKLVAEADNDNWKADGADLQHVRVMAVDNRGRKVVGAADRLDFKVDGPGEIVGVINGDINSNEMTVGESRSLYNGTATVILRSSGESGPVRLTVSSPAFPTATLKLVAK